MSKRTTIVKGPLIRVLRVPLVAPSLNVWYAGTHYSNRKKTRDVWHHTLWGVVKGNRVQPIAKGDYPVTIETQTFFSKGRHKHDTSNLFTANKLAEDAMCAAGLLPDDGPRYVSVHIVLPPIYNHKDYPEGQTVIKIYAK